MNHGLSKEETTDLAIQGLLGIEQAPAPVAHYFGPGIYIREVTFYAGTFAIGHRQRHPHLNVMLKGQVAMERDGEIYTVSAPSIFVGEPGRKSGIILEDTVWLNIYPNPDDERDIDTLEARWLDKGPIWEDHEARRMESEYAAHSEDRGDYEAFLEEFGIDPEVIKAQVEDESDQIRTDMGRITVRKSPIHGLGVFLPAPASPGDVLAPARIHGKRDLAGRFTNHSPNPNAKFQRDEAGNLWLVAIREISGCKGGDQGEEVTIDYRESVKLALQELESSEVER